MASWGSVDFSDLKKLRENIERLDDRRQQFCEDCARELAARLLALVIPRTPVGKYQGDEYTTKTGKTRHRKYKSIEFATKAGKTVRFRADMSKLHGGPLRRGWTAKTEKEAKSGKGRGSVSDGMAYARKLPVKRSGGDYQVTVLNPVEYASYVEFGHRTREKKDGRRGWVKGQYMLSISEHQLDGMVPGILEKKLATYLSEVFDG